MDRERLRQELIRDEGLRLTAYKDSVGLWTIGVGHLLGDQQRMTTITMGECLALLDADIDIAQGVVFGLLQPSALGNDVRYRALVNMAFNLGNRLGGFHHFLDAVNKADWDTAAREMMESKWATQVGARATRLQHMIQTGEVA